MRPLFLAIVTFFISFRSFSGEHIRLDPFKLRVEVSKEGKVNGGQEKIVVVFHDTEERPVFIGRYCTYNAFVELIKQCREEFRVIYLNEDALKKFALFRELKYKKFKFNYIVNSGSNLEKIIIKGHKETLLPIRRVRVELDYFTIKEEEVKNKGLCTVLEFVEKNTGEVHTYFLPPKKKSQLVQDLVERIKDAKKSVAKRKAKISLGILEEFDRFKEFDFNLDSLLELEPEVTEISESYAGTSAEIDSSVTLTREVGDNQNESAPFKTEFSKWKVAFEELGVTRGANEKADQVYLILRPIGSSEPLCFVLPYTKEAKLVKRFLREYERIKKNKQIVKKNLVAVFDQTMMLNISRYKHQEDWLTLFFHLERM